MFVEELDGASVDVVTTLGNGDRGLAHCGEYFIGNAERWCFFDQLLVATLGRAVAGSEVHTVAVCVGENLDFDMAGLAEIPLEVQLASSEIVDRFACRTVDGSLDVVAFVYDFHAATTAAERGFDGHRKAVFACKGGDLGAVGHCRGVAGYSTHTNVLGSRSSRKLVTHNFDGFGAWADEGDAHVGDCLGEICILAEEAVAGMKAIGTGVFEDLQDRFGVQVTLGGCLAPKRIRLVGEADMEGITVEVAVHSDRRDP